MLSNTFQTCVDQSCGKTLRDFPSRETCVTRDAGKAASRVCDFFLMSALLFGASTSHWPRGRSSVVLQLQLFRGIPLLNLLIGGLMLLSLRGCACAPLSSAIPERLQITSIDSEQWETLSARKHCGAMLNVMLVVDNSYSMADRHTNYSEFMQAIVDWQDRAAHVHAVHCTRHHLSRAARRIDFKACRSTSPKIGAVTISKCSRCSACSAMTVRGICFIQRGPIEGGEDLLSCRIRGIRNLLADVVVGASYVDERLCYTDAIDIPWMAAAVTFTVEVTSDGGHYWTNVHELATVNVTCSSYLPLPSSGNSSPPLPLLLPLPSLLFSQSLPPPNPVSPPVAQQKMLPPPQQLHLPPSAHGTGLANAPAAYTASCGAGRRWGTLHGCADSLQIMLVVCGPRTLCAQPLPVHVGNGAQYTLGDACCASCALHMYVRARKNACTYAHAPPYTL